MLWRGLINLIAPFIFLALVLVFACSSAKESSSFAPKAAQGGMEEVELGKLALQNAGDPSVKEFGQRMVTDHSRANTELKTIASRKNLKLPTDLSSEQKATRDKLAKLVGPEFDKAYMADMVKDHEADVKEFQTQASEGTDPDIKGFASNTLPTLEQHLQLARNVAKKVGAQ